MTWLLRACRLRVHRLWVPSSNSLSSQCLAFGNSGFRRIGFSSTASPEPNGGESSHTSNEQKTDDHCSQAENSNKSNRKEDSYEASLETEAEEAELSIDDLVKLVAEKEEQLKLKHNEIEKMQDKVLRSYAEMENVIDRTKCEAENSKKFAIQVDVKHAMAVDVLRGLIQSGEACSYAVLLIDMKDGEGQAQVLSAVLDVEFDEEGKVFGVTSEGETAKCKKVVCDPSYLPNKVRTIGKVARAIAIMSHPIPNTDESHSAQVILPQKQLGHRSDMYLFCCSYTHNVAPKGKYIAFVSTEAETNHPQIELKPGIDLLGPVDEIFYDIYDRYEPVNEPSLDNCFISTSYDATTHFETTVSDVLQMYTMITGKILDLSVDLSAASAAEE